VKPEGRERVKLTRPRTTFIFDYTASLSGVYTSPPGVLIRPISPPWSLQLHCLTDLSAPPHSNRVSILHPPSPQNPLLQHLGLSLEVYSPSKVSVEISRAGSVRRPGPEEAWERRRGALALKRLPSWLFEGGGRTEGKSIGNEQEACDGMANRVSALMFQMLGELIAWLAALRPSAQPCTISSKTPTHKRQLCGL